MLMAACWGWRYEQRPAMAPCISRTLMWSVWPPLCVVLRSVFPFRPSFPHSLDAEGHWVFWYVSLLLLTSVLTAVCLSPPLSLLPLCVWCLWEGVCDSGPVKSDVWDAKGGVIPYFPASSAPAVWSRRPRLLLPPLSSRLLAVSLCGVPVWGQ